MIIIDISTEFTHIKAPASGIETGDFIEKYPLGHFMGPVTIVTLPRGPITGEIVEQYFPRNKERVIFRTKQDNNFFGGAAEDAAYMNYGLLGFDKILGDSNAYRALLANKMVILEGLDLEKVEKDGDYYLVALPLKGENQDSANCRAILLEQEKGI